MHTTQSQSSTHMTPHGYDLQGGGLYSRYAHLEIYDSRIRDNQASGVSLPINTPCTNLAPYSPAKGCGMLSPYNIRVVDCT